MFTKLLTEGIGAFFLVLVIALTGNPIAIGFGLMVMVYMGGHISGAHYNPAITLGAWLSKAISGWSMVWYWLAQMAGAIVATLVAGRLIGATLTPMPGDDVGTLQAIVVEGIFTFALVLVVLNVAVSSKTKGNSYFGLAIGSTILMAAFAGGPLSGGAFNPAVGIGPLLVGMAKGLVLPHWWVYLVGPFAGAAVAALVYKYQEELA